MTSVWTSTITALQLRLRSNWGVRWRRRAVFALIALLALDVIVPPVWRLSEGPIAVVRWPKSGRREIEIGPHMKTWTPIDRVSRHVLHAFIVAEDGRFYEHFGLDFEEIQKSVHTNFEKHRYARGASTITQQVVKMAFLSNEKTIIRKVQEAIGALFVEEVLTKDEILAWYINLAEFGDGVFGLREAAWHYFQTKPEMLTIQQGTHLAIVLPSPNAWSKGLRQRRLTNFGHQRYSTIISLLRASGYITDTLRDSAMATGDFGRPIKGWQIVKEATPDEDELKKKLDEADPETETGPAKESFDEESERAGSPSPVPSSEQIWAPEAPLSESPTGQSDEEK